MLFSVLINSQQISDLASNPLYHIMKLKSRLEPTILDPESNLKLRISNLASLFQAQAWTTLNLGLSLE